MPRILKRELAGKPIPIARSLLELNDFIHVIYGYMQKIQILFPDPVMAHSPRLGPAIAITMPSERPRFSSRCLIRRTRSISPRCRNQMMPQATANPADMPTM